jgi:hypothetical protein
MAPNDIGQAWRLMQIFMPYAACRYTEIKEKNKRMVHYTSAENVFRIIASKTMWMRNTRCMADYREVEHGHDLLFRFFNKEINRNTFFDALDTYYEGLRSRGGRIF